MALTTSRTRLDDLFPRWHHRERHRLAVGDAPADAVWRAVEELTWSEVPAFRALMLIRAFGRIELPEDRAILDAMTSLGFYQLDRTGDEIVVGAIGPLSRERPSRSVELFGDEFRDFEAPGHAKVAFNFRLSSGLLSTETRVWLTDARTRRKFGLYWMVIRLPSGFIRRVWLRAIRRRAVAGMH
jgi:hypothetical protein